MDYVDIRTVTYNANDVYVNRDDLLGFLDLDFNKLSCMFDNDSKEMLLCYIDSMRVRLGDLK